MKGELIKTEKHSISRRKLLKNTRLSMKLPGLKNCPRAVERKRYYSIEIKKVSSSRAPIMIKSIPTSLKKKTVES